jgi:urease accessory protein
MFDGTPDTWHARLTLDFRRRAERTVCAARHSGPLRLQKPLYPEGDATCHAVLIHPPGGIAGGDALAVAIDVAAGAHALVTTPGAGKWYKANGRPASQTLQFKVDGSLEWLPQETIVFNAAQAVSTLDIVLAAGGCMIGWDLVALGRRAMGERFTTGRYAQSIRLTIGDELVWHERTRIAGGDALLDSPIGLAGDTVFGCFWAAGAGVDALDLDELRAALGAEVTAAPLTRLAPKLLVARTRAGSTAAARRAFERVWGTLRPRLLGRPATPPRLWAT